MITRPLWQIWGILSLAASCALCQSGSLIPSSAPSGTGLPLAEQNALLELRSSLNLTAAQLQGLRWDASVPPCTSDCGIDECAWGGIACSGGHVVDVDLSIFVITQDPFLLSGQLPPGLNRLKQLNSLDFSGHSIFGGLPTSWGNMTSLATLSLSNNLLTGPLPPQWAGMTALINVNLSTNQLSGAFPTSWRNIATLRSVDLRGNRLCSPNTGVVGASMVTIFQDANLPNCSSAQIFASQAPALSPAISSATPSPTPASTFQNPNTAPILQMSTGINIAVSVVIGAFLLFGIIAGIFRVKRQQRAHQRWITHRMMTLRQREAQEEAAFRDLIQKIVPPSIVIDPLGDEVYLAQPVSNAQSEAPVESGEGEWEAIGGGSTATTADSLPTNSLSSSVLANDHSSARQASSVGPRGPSEEAGERASASSTPSPPPAAPWQPAGPGGPLPPLREQYAYIQEYAMGRSGVRHRKVPLFTVDIYITDKGSLTYEESSLPPLEGLRPATETTFTAIDLGPPLEAEPVRSSASLTEDRDEHKDGQDQRLGGPSFRIERSAQSNIGPAELSQIEARRTERIERLRYNNGVEGRRGDAPPAPLLRWPALRRAFGLESLQARESRLRRQADQMVRGGQSNS